MYLCVLSTNDMKEKLVIMQEDLRQAEMDMEENQGLSLLFYLSLSFSISRMNIIIK